MELLITVDCAIQTSRKSDNSPEEPIILGQCTQITHLSEAPRLLSSPVHRKLQCGVDKMEENGGSATHGSRDFVTGKWR